MENLCISNSNKCDTILKLKRKGVAFTFHITNTCVNIYIITIYIKYIFETLLNNKTANILHNKPKLNKIHSRAASKQTIEH